MYVYKYLIKLIVIGTKIIGTDIIYYEVVPHPGEQNLHTSISIKYEYI